MKKSVLNENDFYIFSKICLSTAENDPSKFCQEVWQVFQVRALHDPTAEPDQLAEADSALLEARLAAQRADQVPIFSRHVNPGDPVLKYLESMPHVEGASGFVDD